MASLEWEQKWIETCEVFAPTWQTIAGNDEGLLKLSIKFRSEFGVYELREWLRIQLQGVFVLSQDIIEVCI